MFIVGHNCLIVLVQRLSTVQGCVLRGEVEIFCALMAIFSVCLTTEIIWIQNILVQISELICTQL